MHLSCEVSQAEVKEWNTHGELCEMSENKSWLSEKINNPDT